MAIVVSIGKFPYCGRSVWGIILETIFLKGNYERIDWNSETIFNDTHIHCSWPKMDLYRFNQMSANCGWSNKLVAINARNNRWISLFPESRETTSKNVASLCHGIHHMRYRLKSIHNKYQIKRFFVLISLTPTHKQIISKKRYNRFFGHFCCCCFYEPLLRSCRCEWWEQEVFCAVYSELLRLNIKLAVKENTYNKKLLSCNIDNGRERHK